MPACHAGGRGFESRPDRKKASKRGFFDLLSSLSYSILENKQEQVFEIAEPDLVLYAKENGIK